MFRFGPGVPGAARRRGPVVSVESIYDIDLRDESNVAP